MKVLNVAFPVWILLVLLTGSALAADPTPEELAAFEAATQVYESFMEPEEVPDPAEEPVAPPTPEELSAQAVQALRDFLTNYPESELGDDAQQRIGWLVYEGGDYAAARAEFELLALAYPESPFLDDARYQVAFIDYSQGDYPVALAGFESFIAEFEGQPHTEYGFKVPFAYFMAGECYRKLGDMENARAKYGELLEKYPDHPQNPIARQRLSP